MYQMAKPRTSKIQTAPPTEMPVTAPLLNPGDRSATDVLGVTKDTAVCCDPIVEVVVADGVDDSVVMIVPFADGITAMMVLTLSLTLPMKTTSTAANAAVAAKISWCLADVNIASAKAKRLVSPSIMYIRSGVGLT